MSVDPRKELIDNIEKQMDLFQTTVGKANTNVTSTITMIFNSMGQTILAQYDTIQEKNMEIATLKNLEPSNTSENRPESVPDPVTT